MGRRGRKSGRHAALLGCASLLLANPAGAKLEFGGLINEWCTVNSRIPPKPIPLTVPRSCEVCHKPFTFDKVSVVQPAFEMMKQANMLGDYGYFCPLSANSNLPPVLAPIGDQAVAEDQTLDLALSATDPELDALRFSASDLPPGATLVDGLDGTARLRWTPRFDQAGTYRVTFRVEDSGTPLGSDSEQVAISVGDVNRPPVLAPIGSQTVSEGGTLSFPVSATDPDGGALVLAAANLPSGATFADRRDGTGSFVWTPSFTQAGNFAVIVTVNDRGTPVAADSETFTISVGDLNRPPVLQSIGNRTVLQGETLRIGLSAADPDADALRFAVSNAPAGSSFTDAGNGSAEFAWTPGLDVTGNYAVTFSVGDAGQPMASDSEQIVISAGPVNRPPMLSPIGSRQGSEGEPLSILLTATDPDGDGLAFSAMGLPIGATLADRGDGSAEFSWRPGFTQAGNYQVTCVVTDKGMPPASDSEAVTLSIGALNRPPVLGSIGARSIRIGGVLRVPITATDPDGDAIGFRASGVPEGARFMDNRDGTALLAWTPASSLGGEYGVTVTAYDSGTPEESDAETFVIRVEPMIVEPAGPPMQYTLLIRAFWVADSSTLHVKGRGAEPGARVEIVDAESRMPIVQVSADEEGKFRSRVRPLIVPCAVQAITGSNASEPVQVLDAPAECGGEPDLYLRIKEASWSRETGELRVDGDRAPSYAQLEIVDGQSYAPIGSVQADRHGKFRYRGTPYQAPCSVEIRLAGSDVASAPVRGSPCARPTAAR